VIHKWEHQISTCEGICYAYYRSHSCYYEESVSEFLLHPPDDSTRPQGWNQHEYRFSIGETLAAYIDMKAMNERAHKADGILQIFAKQRACFKYPPKNPKAFQIPYKHYCIAFDEAQKSSTIKPDLLQASIYYIQQQ